VKIDFENNETLKLKNEIERRHEKEIEV